MSIMNLGRKNPKQTISEFRILRQFHAKAVNINDFFKKTSTDMYLCND